MGAHEAEEAETFRRPSIPGLWALAAPQNPVKSLNECWTHLTVKGGDVNTAARRWFTTGVSPPFSSRRNCCDRVAFMRERNPILASVPLSC